MQLSIIFELQDNTKDHKKDIVKYLITFYITDEKIAPWEYSTTYEGPNVGIIFYADKLFSNGFREEFQSSAQQNANDFNYIKNFNTLETCSIKIQMLFELTKDDSCKAFSECCKASLDYLKELISKNTSITLSLSPLCIPQHTKSLERISSLTSSVSSSAPLFQPPGTPPSKLYVQETILLTPSEMELSKTSTPPSCEEYESNINADLAQTTISITHKIISSNKVSDEATTNIKKKKSCCRIM